LAHDDIAVTTAAIAKNLQKLLIINDHAPLQTYQAICFEVLPGSNEGTNPRDAGVRLFRLRR
jgi:hypothetical protein